MCAEDLLGGQMPRPGPQSFHGEAGDSLPAEAAKGWDRTRQARV